MRLVFVSGEYPPDVGGVGDYADRLRQALGETGWPSDVLSRRQVRHWDARCLAWLLRVAPRTGIVHIQYQAGAYDLLGDVCLMPGLLRRLRPRTRVVTTFHDTRVPSFSPQRLAAPGRRAIGGPHQPRRGRRRRARPGCPRRPVAASSPRPDRPQCRLLTAAGYNRAAFRAALGLPDDSLVIAYFGLLNASKGLDLLLDTFALIAQQHPAARLLLLGGPLGASDPTDRQTAARLRTRLDHRMLQTGWLAPAALSAHLLAADVAVLPYADGASPRRGSLLACAEHGLPIVSTQPAAPEVCSAVLATEPNPAALADSVLRIAAAPTERTRLHRAGLALARATAWPRIAATHVSIYERLLSHT